MSNKPRICPQCDWQQAWWREECEYCGATFKPSGAESSEADQNNGEEDPLGLILPDEQPTVADEPVHTEPPEDSRLIDGFPNVYNGPDASENDQDTENAADDEQEDPGWDDRAETPGDRVKEYFTAVLFAVPDELNLIEIGGRIIVLGLMLYAGVAALAMSVETGEMATSWLHLIHLIFHEAGHFIFAIFGEFMATAGGTIMQLLMPLLFFFAFLLKYKNPFGAAATLWWFAHSCVDVAPYAYDARSQDLILLGGVTGRDVPGYHDWNNMLSKLDMLKLDHTIAMTFWWAGALIMVLAIVWAGWLLYLQIQSIRENDLVLRGPGS